MKKIFRLFLSFLLVVTCFACQTEKEIDNIGYLSFDIDTYVSVFPGSKTIVDGYQPKRLTVQIIDDMGQVVYHTDDYDHWDLKGEKLPLAAGNYSVRAHSYGFDGKDSGFDVPYYAGSKDVIIKKGELNIVEFTCTQQNVKVTVNFDPSFVEAFKQANAKISSSVAGVQPVTIQMGTTSSSAYFPTGKLSSTISVVNKNDKEFTQTDIFAENAKPRSHYILNYKVTETGSGDIKVETDKLQHVYTITFKVSTKSETQLNMDQTLAWSNFAIVKGSVLAQEAGNKLDAQLMTFQYKPEKASTWSEVAAVLKGNSYEAKLVGLQPNTKYTCKMSYKGEQKITSNEVVFTTEAMTLLPNGNLDDWYQSGKTWYAISASDFNADRRFWDSSNPGTTTGAAASIGVNPTQGVTSPAHTSSGKSAQLKSQFAGIGIIGKFAAASLYSGKFNTLVGMNGAKLDLGQPFTSRPTQLTGWYQYSTGSIDYVGKNQPSGTLDKGDQDVWSGYIALTTGSYTLDNTNLAETAKDYEKLLHDDGDNFVVAYGELSASECTTSSSWKKFTINLTYKNLVMKPTHVIIVFSSSRYGDYFTGSTNSLLYLDDLELVYGNNPEVVSK